MGEQGEQLLHSAEGFHSNDDTIEQQKRIGYRFSSGAKRNKVSLVHTTVSFWRALPVVEQLLYSSRHVLVGLRSETRLHCKGADSTNTI
jgi:hypothetical protein